MVNEAANNGNDTTDANAGPNPSAVLAIAGNEHRLAILHALFAAEDNCLGYAELMDAVGMDDSGGFSYHLRQLVGPFVRKTDDGYRLRHAGAQVVGAIMAGTYAEEQPLGPVEMDAPCLACGGTLLAGYDGDIATIECADCDTIVTRDSVPPGIFEGVDDAGLPRVLGRWVRHGFARTMDGFCPVCSGPTEATLGTAEHEALDQVGVELTCDRCGMRFTGSLGSTVLDHPAVVCFYYDHGIHLRRVPVWELDWLQGYGAELIGTDPPNARLTIGLDEETLTLTFGADLAVRSIERTGP